MLWSINRNILQDRSDSFDLHDFRKIELKYWSQLDMILHENMDIFQGRAKKKAVREMTDKQTIKNSQ